jgi:hypothetical protein
MTALREAGIRPDIRYRLLCAENITRTSSFFPCFEGKTCELQPDGTWHMTFAGDGIVPHADSVLPGAALEILPASPTTLDGDAGQYCHIRLPRAPEVVERVVSYLHQDSLNTG